ncbi:TonB-dependent receptor plug domain-containing protein [Sphingobium tyrosinilyticum]|uniref:TonB-dependent receptor plug domain-containing protein n=1 Tax=Sphingobium tyrosinilyticum TaxID=2715436 RepID=A0ABV9F171_9SPHN
MISMRSRMALTASSLIFVAMSSVPAAAVDAVTADAAAAAALAEDSGLTVVTVTAQKRPESLQSTPISMSVMRAEDLVSRHVTSLVDLGDGSIPSLKIAPFYSRSSALVVNIRGIGVLSDANQPARDQGVGVYIDGVYLGRAQGLGTALFDIENVEVLKGPQGTLFGRNTEGGAVNIVTKKPSGELHVNATGGIGNFGAYKGEMHLDLPSFNDIAVKIDGVVAHRDPLVKKTRSPAPTASINMTSAACMSKRCGRRPPISAPTIPSTFLRMNRPRSTSISSRPAPTRARRSPRSSPIACAPPMSACRCSPASAMCTATA